jgi:rhamnosyl/mannosyltransferase
MVQLEAMVYGKPVINTDLETGVPEVSIHGQTGITVPAGDAEKLAEAIQTLTDRDDLRGKFGENAYNRVREHFNLDKVIENLFDLYVRVAEKN